MIVRSKTSGATKLFFAAMISASALPVQAQTASDDPAAIGFRSFDLNGDGFIRPNEADAYLTLIFRAMDSNSDNLVSNDEFKKFSLGFLALAEKNGKVAQYEKARDVIYKRWLGRKDTMTVTSMTTAVRQEFAKIGGEKPGIDLRLNLEQFRRVQFVREMAESVK
jgi:EF hand